MNLNLVISEFFVSTDVEILENLYEPTHLRASPWIIGIVLGYVIFKIKNKIIIFTKVINNKL